MRKRACKQHKPPKTSQVFGSLKKTSAANTSNIVQSYDRLELGHQALTGSIMCK